MQWWRRLMGGRKHHRTAPLALLNVLRVQPLRGVLKDTHNGVITTTSLGAA